MSNDREDLEARIAAYIDGELPPADAARLEVFLANTDPALAEQVIGMIGDRHQIRALPKARAPEELAARIVEQVERATLLNNVEHLTAHHRPWWQSRIAIAACVMLVLGCFSYFILEALHPANPAWQAAVDSHPAAPVAAAPVPAAAPMIAAAKDADQPVAVTSEPAAEDHPAVAVARAATVPAGNAADAANDEPVFVTLLAQTPEDVPRLHAAIERLLAAAVPGSPRQALDQQMPFAKASDRTRANATQAAASLAAANAQEPQNEGMAHENVPQQPDAPLTTQNAVQAEAPEMPMAYHLTLLPSQVERLTQQFHVLTAMRGNQPFALSPAHPAATMEAGKAVEKSAPLECIITILPPPAASPGNPPLPPTTRP